MVDKIKENFMDNVQAVKIRSAKANDIEAIA
jgi:hypothetical protein